MRNRSRRSRRRRSNNSETRIRLIKIMVVLLVLFLPFQKETLYYLDYVWNLVKFRGQIPPNLIDPTPALGYFLNLFFGLVIYIISLYLFAFFNSQFLLPVYSRKQRFQVYEHFLQFVRGNYGPLIFVRDGQEISHFGEREKEGPGVVLINSNSAVVVGNRVHGPGIVFTGDKRIKSLFDLRKQIRSRRKVTAITRDGIEIETDIFVQFGISGTPHVIFVCENNNQIQVVEFNNAGNIASLSPNLLEDDEAREIRKTLPNLIRGNHQNLPILNLQDFFATRFISDRVQTVFNNQPRDPQTGKKIDWRDLPLAIAVEEFRNIIVRYPFDELFIRQDSQSRLRAGDLSQYPMNNIRREFSQLMRLSGMVAYVFVEAPGGQPLQIGANQSNLIFYPPLQLISRRPLSWSAISVGSAGFGEITPTNEDVKNQTIQNLIARWKSEAFRTEVGFDEQAALIRSRAKTQVQQDTVYALAEFLENNDRVKTAIILRIFQALEAATAESNNPELVSMVNMLSDMREWFS